MRHNITENTPKFLITRPDVVESFLNFKVAKKDLLIGNRAYGRLKGLKYVKNKGGEFLVRLKNKAFNLYANNNKKFNMLQTLMWTSHILDLKIFSCKLKFVPKKQENQY